MVPPSMVRSLQPGLFSVLDIYPGSAWDLFKQFLGSDGSCIWGIESIFRVGKGLFREFHLYVHIFCWFLRQIEVHAYILDGYFCACNNMFCLYTDIYIYICKYIYMCLIFLQNYSKHQQHICCACPTEPQIPCAVNKNSRLDDNGDACISEAD